MREKSSAISRMSDNATHVELLEFPFLEISSTIKLESVAKIEFFFRQENSTEKAKKSQFQ